MSGLSLLYPVFALVALTFAVGFMSGGARRAAVLKGEVRVRDIALGEPAWPTRVIQLGNNYNNQFQAPLLFYVLVAFAMITGAQSVLLVVLAWLFVASRIAHSYIHITANNVPRRFRAFLSGAIILVIMWLALLWHAIALDQDDFGLNRAKIVNLIDSSRLERDAGGTEGPRKRKPVPAFPHPALGAAG